ncbi:hypothetical protein Q5P01_011750 [Channa striata]|uniref:C-type lectin domain-containing protein n=1 Tax=Channa striata TaxID=64152 RepID=A0AA88MTZ1_CHASR|nr:hypothetical protein Q5P01_011750 [Channa striata]
METKWKEDNVTRAQWSIDAYCPKGSNAEKQEETVYDEVKGKTKSSQQTSEPQAKKEEQTVYAEVKGQHQTSGQTADTKVEKTGRPHWQWLACCLGILCVILLCGIISVTVYIALRPECDVSELNQLKENLTNHNEQLSSENEKLNRTYNNLQAQYDNLTQAYTVLERNITTLTAQNQELESQRKNLTEQIRDMETKWKEDNVTRAQWSIDAYCPKGSNGSVKLVRNGWLHSTSSCYAINDFKDSNQKTWEEARENCRGKISDLAVIVNEAQKDFTTTNSWNSDGISGYWIGLKVEDGRWKWVDGSNLTNE